MSPESPAKRAIDEETALGPKSGYGCYIHFPWCLSKCGYCDFYSVAQDDPTAIDHDGYADAVIGELHRRLERLDQDRVFPTQPLTTLYLGGGTPSLWRTQALARVVRTVLSAFSAPPSAVEITVECNPSSFDQRVASGLLEAGVNRVSLGIQSLDDAQLSFLGRRHDRQLALDALEIALKSGIPRVSADCLFGLPQQSLKDELSQIEHLASLPLSHLSAYALTIEESTPFGRLARAGRLPIAVEDRVADAFLAVHQLLETYGYEHYEISNFARPLQRSLHNQQYWWGLPYLSLGASAVGAVALGERWLRYRNPANVRKYLALPFADPTLDVFGEAPSGALESLEWLEPNTRLRERIMLGLRLVEGLDIDAAGAELGVIGLTPERHRNAQRLIANGRLSNDGTRYFIDPKAWLLADGTIAQLM